MSRLKKLIEELCPDGVEFLPLNDIATFGGGKTPSKKDPSNYCENGINWMTSKDVKATKLWKSGITISDKGATGLTLFPADTIVMVARSGILQKYLPIAILCEPSTVNQDLKTISAIDGIEPMYLLYALQAKSHHYLAKYSKAGTVDSVEFESIKREPLPIPPHEVQCEIVRILDAMQELDDVLSREIEARTLQTRFSIDVLLGTDDCQPDEDWMTLNDLCESIVDGDHQAPPQSDSGVPFLVISNFNSGRISLTDTKHVLPDYYENLDDRRKPSMGDVLLSVTGSYGIAAIVESDTSFCFQRHVALLKPKVNSLFILALMRSAYAKKYFDNVATGSAQKTIPLTKLRSMPVPPISADKQDAIAESFGAMLELAKLQEDELAKRRKQFEYCRDKLLDFPEKAV